MQDQHYTDAEIRSQPKLYDKIIKENMHRVLPKLIRDVFGIAIVDQTALPESVQYTKEKIPDQLSKVTDAEGNTYILHIEWQSEDDPAMDDRMLTYRAMLRRKYGLNVRQYVIYLARPKSRMPFCIEEENLKFSYYLISLQQYSHKIFLDSTVPEQKLLAIFGNFETTSPVEVITEIVKEVTSTAKGSLDANRYVRQLRVLVKLRKLKNEFIKAMETLTQFEIEEDIFYIDGLEKGREEGRKEGIEQGLEKGRMLEREMIIEKLITQYNLSNQQVAQLANTSDILVEQIRHKLSAGNF